MKSLKAEIDEARIEASRGTVSLPFEPGEHKRIAVKIVDDRGIDGRIEQGDTFHNDRFPDLRADYILANPPFNVSDWGGERLREDKRWKYGVPPVGNANFAWVQHIVHHLAPAGVDSAGMRDENESKRPRGKMPR